ncbi:hypothetical protein ABZP36_014392 [Zizania latifolia]
MKHVGWLQAAGWAQDCALAPSEPREYFTSVDETAQRREWSKSESMIWPSSLTRTFSGLRSQYTTPSMCIRAGSHAGLNANPLVTFSGVFGTGAFAVGADYNAGLSHTTEDLTATLNLNKGDSLATSYYHKVNGTTAVGAELAHSFSSNENTLTFGTQHDLDELTTVKVRFNSYGMASALVQH